VHLHSSSLPLPARIKLPFAFRVTCQQVCLVRVRVAQFACLPFLLTLSLSFSLTHAHAHTHIHKHTYCSESQETALTNFHLYLIIGMAIQTLSSMFASRVLGVDLRARWRMVTPQPYSLHPLHPTPSSIKL